MGKKRNFEKSIRKFDRLNRIQMRLFWSLSRNTVASNENLLKILGLDIFSLDSAPPNNYRRSGRLLIEKSTSIELSIFSFGVLKGSHQKSLANFFRLAVLVVTNPREEKDFYLDILDSELTRPNKGPRPKGRKVSSDFIEKHLQNFKNKRIQLIASRTLKNSPKYFIRDSLVLLQNMMIGPTEDHPFIFKFNNRHLSTLIRQEKDDFI